MMTRLLLNRTRWCVWTPTQPNQCADYCTISTPWTGSLNTGKAGQEWRFTGRWVQQHWGMNLYKKLTIMMYNFEHAFCFSNLFLEVSIEKGKWESWYLLVTFDFVFAWKWSITAGRLPWSYCISFTCLIISWSRLLYVYYSEKLAKMHFRPFRMYSLFAHVL